MLSRIKKELPFVILVLLCYFVIPHIALSVPGFDRGAAIWTVHWIEPFNSVLYFFLVSCQISFVGGTFALAHFLLGADFSPLLIAEAALGVATLFPRMPLPNWIALAFGVVFFALMECFTLLNRITSGAHPLLRELQANRCFLGWLFYLSIGMQLVCHVKITFLMGFFPIPVLILAFGIGILPFFQGIEGPLTRGGVLGIIVMGAVSVLFAWYQKSYASGILFLLTMISGYCLLATGEIGLYLVRIVVRAIRKSRG